MVFGRNDSESGTEGRSGGNRPDCAYFLLLGLCGAAFLLTIGGILTYIAFNPGSVDSRPHSPLSHVPHFHHHRKHHDRTEGHYFGHYEPHNYHHDEQKQHQLQQHHEQHGNSHGIHTATTGLTGETTVATPTSVNSTRPTVSESNEARGTKTSDADPAIVSEDNGTTPGSHLGAAHPSKETTQSSISSGMPHKNYSITGGTTHEKEAGRGNNSADHHHSQQEENSGQSHHTNYNKNNSSHHPHPLDSSSTGGTSSHHPQQHGFQQIHPHPGIIGTATHHNGKSNGDESQAKQSLALAIIGPLCLLMGIIVTLIVGVFALKYDCDHEPEPNIAFLRLRSEMSLNFDPSKNNYELLMPASSSTAGVGSTHSIHPGGMPRC